MYLYLFSVLIVETPQHKYIDEWDEEGGVCVELLLLHKDVRSVTQVEVQHDETHLANGL